MVQEYVLVFVRMFVLYQNKQSNRLMGEVGKGINRLYGKFISRCVRINKLIFLKHKAMEL